MNTEQEQRLQQLDVEIQIAEKQLRVAGIKKQILEVELDILGLNQELEQRANRELTLVRGA
jgi:hypothetical protein